jgi:glycosyltransferase involved in cell wall biosynthesis
MERLPLAVCLMIKNEREFLSTCLGSVCEWAEEIVIGDSGSSDGSQEMAREFTSRVPRLEIFTLEWRDDFSWGRNQVAKKAQSEWIFFLDGDEWIDDLTRQGIEECIRSGRAEAYSLIQRNYTRDPSVEMSRPLSAPYPKGLEEFQSAPLFYLENSMERLYRRESGLVYEGIIHESLLPSAKRLNKACEKTSLIIHHAGRLKKQSTDKAAYYLSLSRKKLEREPQNAAAWIEVMMTLMELKEFDAAYEFAQEATKFFKSEPEVYKLSFQAAQRAEDWLVAERWIRHYLSFYPQDSYAQGQLTTALLYQGKLDECARLAESILKSDPNHFIAHVNLAVIFFERQNWKEASFHIAQGLQMRPEDQFLRDAMSKIPTAFQIR